MSRRQPAQKRARSLQFENLETRQLMSATPNSALAAGFAEPLSAQYSSVTAGLTNATTNRFSTTAATSTANPNPAWLSASDVRTAYGMNTLDARGLTGAGQTIAVIVPFDVMSENQETPKGPIGPVIATLQDDLNTFSQAYSLPTVKINGTLASESASWQSGVRPPSAPFTSSFQPSVNPNAYRPWGREAALDIEWAHAMAPGADIDLFEAQSNSTADLMATVDLARNTPNVSVITMSWSVNERALDDGLGNTELQFDSILTTPKHHIPVTFITGSGDHGGVSADPHSAPQFPASSPNVLAVGGTKLTIQNGGYGAETSWSNTYEIKTDSKGNTTSTTTWGSTGGISEYEPQPSYMKSFMPSLKRTTPDVAFNGDISSPVNVYYTEMNGWNFGAGTSLGSPAWAGITAVANQARAQNHLPTLGHLQQDIYLLPAGDFHDITTGSNGYAALSGYDMVTGRGSPRADLFVNDMVNRVEQGLFSTVGVLGTAGTPITTVGNTTAMHTGTSAKTAALSPLLPAPSPWIASTDTPVNRLSADLTARPAVFAATEKAIPSPNTRPANADHSLLLTNVDSDGNEPSITSQTGIKGSKRLAAKMVDCYFGR